MGRKSRYSEYAKGMKKKADAKNAATKSHNKSIKDRLKNLKERTYKCIFRKNCASVPEERSAIPLQTEQSSAG